MLHAVLLSEINPVLSIILFIQMRFSLKVFSLFNFHNGFILKFAHVSEQCKLCWNYNHKIILIFLTQCTPQNCRWNMIFYLRLMIFDIDHQFSTEIMSASWGVGETPWQDNDRPVVIEKLIKLCQPSTWRSTFSSY